MHSLMCAAEPSIAFGEDAPRTGVLRRVVSSTRRTDFTLAAYGH